MRAAVVEAFKEPLTVWNDWPDPEVGPDDVLVKVEANGICRSDWHLWQGNWDSGFPRRFPPCLGTNRQGRWRRWARTYVASGRETASCFLSARHAAAAQHAPRVARTSVII